MMIRRLFRRKVVGVVMLLCCLGYIPETEAQQTGPISVSLRPTQILPVADQLLALGKKTYTKECAPCHGLDGRGQGDAAYLLYLKPRDFVTAQFRLVSTWECVPTGVDLYTTISRGIPGSAMPSWAHLTEETQWELVHYIKTFAENPIKPNTAESENGTGIIKVPPELRRARKNFSVMLLQPVMAIKAKVRARKSSLMMPDIRHARTI